MMKRYLFILSILLCVNASVSAQFRKIPANVTELFTQKYPMATSIEWRDKLSGYIASFKLNDTAFSAYFNNDGDWTSTEQQIEPNLLPSPVKESYGKSKYSEWEIGIVQQILLPGGQKQYRVQAIKSELRKRNLYFDPEGKLLRDLGTL